MCEELPVSLEQSNQIVVALAAVSIVSTPMFAVSGPTTVSALNDSRERGVSNVPCRVRRRHTETRTLSASLSVHSVCTLCQHSQLCLATVALGRYPQLCLATVPLGRQYAVRCTGQL